MQLPQDRIAMISARFNETNKDTEKKFRAVCELLRARGLTILMVDAGGGDDFGVLTARYLRQLKRARGVMLSVCTPDYAEKTKSSYSSFAELKYAKDNEDCIDVVPLRVDDIYPPRPPWGEDHIDKHGDAEALVEMVMPNSKVYLDCRDKKEDALVIRT
ncbi:unnamed protein product, partial [Symbiodinium sp. CCMP2456]